MGNIASTRETTKQQQNEEEPYPAVRRLPERAVDILRKYAEGAIEGDVLDLAFKELDEDMMPELCEWLKRLEGKINVISMGGNLVKSKGACTLFDELRKSKSIIRQLDLQGAQITDDAIESLGEYVKYNQSIVVIDIMWNKLTDDGIEKLSNYLVGNKTFKKLGLGGNHHITDKSVPLLKRIIETSHIEHISINRTGISKSNALVVPLIFNALKHQVDTIDTGSCEVSDEDMVEISKGVKKYGCENVKKVSLFGNKITSEGAILLFNSLCACNSRVEELIMFDNKIDDEAMNSLGACIKINTSIKEIRIGDKITDDGIDILSSYLIGNQSLKTLSLSSNKRITKKSTPLLINIIQSSNIEDLTVSNLMVEEKHVFDIPLAINKLRMGSDIINMRGSQLNDQQISLFCDAIQKYGRKELKEIDLGNNQITSVGAKKLIDTLKNFNSNIEKFNIESNNIDDECTKAIGEYIQENKYIQSLMIGNSKITDKGVETLSQYLIGNTSLKHLSMAWNKDISAESVVYIIEIAKSSCIKSIDLVGTKIQSQDEDYICELLLIPEEDREIPIRSNSKSAAKSNMIL